MGERWSAFTSRPLRRRRRRSRRSGVDKYEALRELTVARGAFGVTDRALSVLQALLSFHPGRALGGNAERPVVYPSNRALSERLNGMPDSTLRRHLAALVRAGVLLRRDSPNGKRYARRGEEGTVAFGFDLSPLATRHDEIIEAARAARAAQERHRRLAHQHCVERHVTGVAYGSGQNDTARVKHASVAGATFSHRISKIRASCGPKMRDICLVEFPRL